MNKYTDNLGFTFFWRKWHKVLSVTHVENAEQSLIYGQETSGQMSLCILNLSKGFKTNRKVTVYL
jgi:hypothetical protein